MLYMGFINYLIVVVIEKRTYTLKRLNGCFFAIFGQC